MKLVLIPDSGAGWADRLMADVPGLTVLSPDPSEVADALHTADAAYGVLPAELLAVTTRLRWLQAPQAGPPARLLTPKRSHRSRHPVQNVVFASGLLPAHA